MTEERRLGIEADKEHFKRKTMDDVWVCGPEISEGMIEEIRLAAENGIPVICRSEWLRPGLENILENL